MDIDQDYLSSIFKGDQLFVFAEDSRNEEYKSERETADPQEMKEPQVEISSETSEAKVPSKEVVILVNAVLNTDEKVTLMKLLKAISIEDDEYEIIHEHPEQLKAVQHLKLFLSFNNQYVQSSDYSILKINKGNAIYAHDLAELNKDSSKKLMLWNLLKTIV